MTKPATDWEAVEREYRAGQLSVSEIGRQHSVSHTAINKRAKNQGWTRNLAAKVRQVVSDRLVSDEVSAANARETVDAAAARVVDVVRSHRKDIATGRLMAQALFEELAEATQHRDEIEEAIEEDTAGDSPGNQKRRQMMLRAVALPSRASTLQSLAGAVKTLVQLERQAFNIDTQPDDDGAPSGGGSALERLVARLDRAKRTGPAEGADGS